MGKVLPGDMGEELEWLMRAAVLEAEIGRRTLDRMATRPQGALASGVPRQWDQRRRFGLELVSIGLDHTTAGIELRERPAFSQAEVAVAPLRRFTDPADAVLEQAAMLFTCNRVELYGVTRSRPSAEELAALLARSRGVEPDELRGALYVHRGEEVAHHLAAVAAGLLSLVIGGAQIQGQVRSALGYALRAGTTSELAAKQLVKRGAGRTLLVLIDLAVPRDVDPAVSGLAGVEVRTLDDLSRSSRGPSCDGAVSSPPRRPCCASRSPAFRTGCGVARRRPDEVRRCLRSTVTRRWAC